MEKSTLGIIGAVGCAVVGLGFGIYKSIDSYYASKREERLCNLAAANKKLDQIIFAQTEMKVDEWISLLNATIKDANKAFGQEILAEVMILKGFTMSCGKYRKNIDGVEIELSVKGE